MSEYFDPYADNAENRVTAKKNYFFWGCLGCFGLMMVFSVLVGVGIYVWFDDIKALAELGQGAIALEEENQEKAIKHFSNAIELNGNFAEAYILRGETYRQMGKYEEALSDCNRAIELQPRKADHYNIRGLVYDAMGKSEKALEDFKKALELGDNDPIIYSNIALTYRDLEDYDNALRFIQQAIEKNPKELFLIYHRGIIYQSMGSYDKAITDFESCMKFGKSFLCGDETIEQSDVEDDYVSCLAEMKQYDKVNAYWESKIAKESSNLDHYESYLYALLDQQEYDKAEKLLDRALASVNDPSEKNDLYEEWIDSFVYENDQQERTLALANRYIADTNESEAALLKLTDVYENQDRYEDAIEIYNRLIDLNSKDKGMYYRYRSFCYENLEQYDLALADFEQYGQIDEKNCYFYSHRAHLYQKLKQFDKSLEDINQALVLYSEANANHPEHLYISRAEIHEQMENLQMAEEDFTKAIESDCSFHAYKERARYYIRHDKDQLALDDLNHLIEKLDSDDTDLLSGEYWKLRAEVHEKLGEPDKAEADRRKAAEVNAAFKERWGYSLDDESEEEK